MTLRVHLHGATGLRAADKNGLSDPYVKLSAAGQSVQSKILSRTLDPIWDQELELMGPGAAFRKEGLSLEVFDSDKLSRDDSLGFVAIELASLHDGVARDHHEFLRNKPGGRRTTHEKLGRPSRVAPTTTLCWQL